MPALRYADQERRNIAASEDRSRQQAALNGSIARRKATAQYAAKLEWTAVPETAESPGIAGQIAYEAGFLYVCVDTDTWERSPLSAW